MRPNEIKEKLLYGEKEAINAIEYIMNNGIVTVSNMDFKHIRFTVNGKKDEIILGYNTYDLVMNVIHRLKKNCCKVYKLETDFDIELESLTCSCREDLLKKKREENIREAQALFMNCMQYKLNDPANITEVEISEFTEYLKERNMDAFNEFENLREQYRIQEV